MGNGAGINVTTADHVICVGNPGTNVSNSCFIGNIRGVTTAHEDAIPVYIDSAGQLGTVGSSRRFKKEIKPMGNASESILGLRPVTFHYNSDSDCTPQFGLIAEEVAESNPDLVVRDENGAIYTVRYDAVNAMLLNEFLKEHRKVEEQQTEIDNQEETISRLKSGAVTQEATIAELKRIVAKQEKGMAALAARLKEQDSKIQKVSAQIEMGMPAPKVVVNQR